MKRFTLETLGYITFTLGLILVIGSQFKGCQADPIPESQARLPVEQNFKLWTEDDFKQAEVDPLAPITSPQTTWLLSTNTTKNKCNV